MAVNNPPDYGFRPYAALSGKGLPPAEELFIATGASFDVNGGASNVNLRPGDPLIRLSTGGVTLAAGIEAGGGTAVVPTYICVGLQPYYDATIGTVGGMRRSNKIPSDISWGTNTNRQTKLMGIRTDLCIWECDVDENTTATTLAAYQAFVGENVDHILTGASGDAFGGLYANPLLSISDHGTGTQTFRIWGVSKTKNNMDFAGTRVKLLVVLNEAATQIPWGGATGV